MIAAMLVTAAIAIWLWRDSGGSHRPSDCLTEYMADTKDVRITCP